MCAGLEVDGLSGGNALAVDVDAVGGVQIFNPVVIALANEASVAAGDGGLGGDEVAVRGSADNPRLNGGLGLGLGGGFDWRLWIGCHRSMPGTGNTIARVGE